MAILNNSNAISSGGYDINNSLRLRRSNNAYLSRTPASAGNQQTWTYSAWVKRGLLGSIQDIWHANGSGTSENDYFAFDSDTLQFRIKNSNTVVCELITTQVFRDPSAWYHIVLAWDSTQATSSNRVKIYINGTQITAFTTATYPAQNTNTNSYNSTVLHTIGTQWYNSTLSNYYDGYITEVNFVNAQALTPSSFGETDTTTGSWKPKAYSGTYGTNGFYLKFSDIATTSGSNAGLGKDFSGNANYFTTNNISVTAGTTYDAMIDSPTLTSATVANYAVLNPIAGQGNGTYSNANLAWLNGNSAAWKSGVGSLGVSSGKYYFEYTITSVSSSNYFYLGVAGSTYKNFSSYLGQTSDSWAFQWNGASSNKLNNDTPTTVSTAGSISVNDVIQIAIDLGTGSIWWGRNNTWVQGDPSAGTGASYTNLSGTILPGFAIYSNGGDKIDANFGQRPFAYTPPTGFVRLNTYNLPDSTIKKGNTVMDATLYTGTGATQVITNAGAFKPDFVWMKTRNVSANSNLVDSVRGVTKLLQSNSTGAEATNTDVLSSFNSNGFTVVSDYGSNYAGNTYVGWQWQAGQGTNTTNTAGTVTSTVSVNTTAGFSIVLYTGNGGAMTMGHGLGVAPKLIILKDRDIGRPWPVYHGSLATNQYLILNTTAAVATSTSYWNNTAPTSTVFSVNGLEGNVGANGEKYVAYCWAEIAGFSKFGSYTGNGSADGTFIYTGFRPKYLLIKRTDSAGYSWFLWDSVRNTYNVAQYDLYPNVADAEGSGDYVDILSNGFKMRDTGASRNASGGTYIYMAFAEVPTKFANAR